MKRKVFIFAVLICFFAADVFSQEQIAFNRVNRVPFNWEMVNMIKRSENNLNDLNYFLSIPLTIMIEDDSIEPRFSIDGGNLLFSEQYLNSLRVDIPVNLAGRFHLFYDSPQGAEVIEVIFIIQERLVTLRFKRNASQNNFVLFSSIINGRPYSLSSETQLPSLMISSNLGF